MQPWFRWDIIQEYAPLFVEGAWMTVKSMVVCVIVGTSLGLLLGVGRLAEARHAPLKYVLKYLVQYPVRVYVSFFRGTPLFVQILMIHFALMPLLISPNNGLIFSGEMGGYLRSTYGAFIAA